MEPGGCLRDVAPFLKQGTCGELFGYGYLPLPLTPAKSTTAGTHVPTGDQSWTLFLNTGNFKGPVAFFTPYFWSAGAVAEPLFSGMLLDSRPSDPNRALQMETQHVPSLQAVDAKGETYARIAPTFFPCETDGESRLVHHITSYTKQALWDAVQTWFGGGAEASGAINTEGAVLHQFTGKGGATWRIYPDGTPREERVPVAWSSFATPMAADPNTFGYRWDPQFVKQTDSKQGPLVKLPEYFRLVKSGAKSQWVPVQAEEVPAETGLTQARFDRPERRPKAYVTPEDEASCWKKPGPQAGPFQAHPGDGSVVTYYWSPIFFDRNESPTRRTHARCPPRRAFPGLGRWQGCKALAEKVAKSSHQEDPIVRSLNALALLASGDSAYLPLVKKEAQWAAGYSSRSMQTWHYGYVMLLLSEYVLATGDQSVMPGLRRLALEAANGQIGRSSPRSSPTASGLRARHWAASLTGSLPHCSPRFSRSWSRPFRPGSCFCSSAS